MLVADCDLGGWRSTSLKRSPCSAMTTHRWHAERNQAMTSIVLAHSSFSPAVSATTCRRTFLPIAAWFEAYSPPSERIGHGLLVPVSSSRLHAPHAEARYHCRPQNRASGMGKNCRCQDVRMPPFIVQLPRNGPMQTNPS